MLFAGLRLGWRSVPLFWLLDFAGAQVSLPGHDPAPTLDALYALADVSALVAVLLLPDARRRFFGMFDSTAAMLWFLVAAAAISSAVSVLMSMAMLGVAVELSAVRGVSVWDTGLRWFLGSYVGAVVVAPLLVAWDARRGPGAGGWHVAGAAALLALVLALAVRVPLPARRLAIHPVARPDADPALGGLGRRSARAQRPDRRGLCRRRRARPSRASRRKPACIPRPRSWSSRSTSWSRRSRR